MVNCNVSKFKLAKYKHYIYEATAIINIEEFLPRKSSSVDVNIKVEALLGEHKTIKEQSLSFDLDDYLGRMYAHQMQFIPQLEQYTSYAII